MLRLVLVLSLSPSRSFYRDIPILVEQSCGEGDSLHDKLQVLDALALLLECHGTTVVDVDDNIVESKPTNVSRISCADRIEKSSPDDIHSDLSRNVPCLDKLVDLLSSALSSLLDARVTRGVEALKTLLLDGFL